MTQRERTLAGVLGGSLAIVAGITAVKSLVLKPFDTQAGEIRDANIERAALKKRGRTERKWEAEWREIGTKTLHGDAVYAQQMFREDMHALIRKHRLQGKVPLNPSQPSTNRKTGLTELSMRISVTGTVKQITGMLRDCYRRPYRTQIHSLTIDAGEGKLKKGETSKPVVLSMKISTLVLPDGVEGVKLEPIGELVNMADKVDETRLALAPGKYDEIASINMYQWPTPPKRAKRPTNTIVKNTDEEPKPPVGTSTRTTRPDADKLHVVACVSHGGELSVYVQKRVEDAPDIYRIDDEIKDEGRLIMIRPDGMVIRDTDKSTGSGGRTAETDYFYPIGEVFKKREEVSPKTHPEIYAEIQRLAVNR